MIYNDLVKMTLKVVKIQCLSYFQVHIVEGRTIFCSNGSEFDRHWFLSRLINSCVVLRHFFAERVFFDDNFQRRHARTKMFPRTPPFQDGTFGAIKSSEFFFHWKLYRM